MAPDARLAAPAQAHATNMVGQGILTARPVRRALHARLPGTLPRPGRRHARPLDLRTGEEVIVTTCGTRPPLTIAPVPVDGSGHVWGLPAQPPPRAGTDRV
jgi:hypothetical protein